MRCRIGPVLADLVDRHCDDLGDPRAPPGREQPHQATLETGMSAMKWIDNTSTVSVAASTPRNRCTNPRRRRPAGRAGILDGTEPDAGAGRVFGSLAVHYDAGLVTGHGVV